MAAPRVLQFDSLAALRAAAPAWDDLWRRSAVAMPIARAEPIAQYVEQFGHRDTLHARWPLNAMANLSRQCRSSVAESCEWRRR